MTTDEMATFIKSKPSDDDLLEKVNEFYSNTGENFTDAEKIAAFDTIAAKVAQLWGQNEEVGENGNISENSDNMHYLGETVLQALFGNRIWSVQSIFESY